MAKGQGPRGCVLLSAAAYACEGDCALCGLRSEAVGDGMVNDDLVEG